MPMPTNNHTVPPEQIHQQFHIHRLHSFSQKFRRCHLRRCHRATTLQGTIKYFANSTCGIQVHCKEGGRGGSGAEEQYKKKEKSQEEKQLKLQCITKQKKDYCEEMEKDHRLKQTTTTKSTEGKRNIVRKSFRLVSLERPTNISRYIHTFIS